MNDKRPQITYLCWKLPIPVRGGTDLRVLSQIMALSTFCDVDVVAISGNPHETRISEIPVRCLGRAGNLNQQSLALSLFDKGSSLFEEMYDYAVGELLKAHVDTRGPDVVIVSRIQSWLFARNARSTKPARFILDLDESLHSLLPTLDFLPYTGAPRRVHRRFTEAMAHFEDSVIHEADHVWVASTLERDRVASLHGAGLRVTTIPNAVKVPLEVPADRAPGDPVVLFPANLAYPPNTFAAREIRDSIAPAIPDAHFRIVGAHALPALTESLPAHVTVVSPVPDMASEFARATLALMPIRAGSGTRLKALECFAWGVPAVGTAMAFEGLDVRHGREVVVAESTSDLIDATRHLLHNPHARQDLVTHGGKFVQEHHSIEAITPLIHDSVTSVLSRTV